MNILSKHIILGAGGAISRNLAREIISRDEKVKLVSRSGYSEKGAESCKADLTVYSQVKDSIEESSIVYLTAGLQYNKKIWSSQWPVIMQNTIDACKSKNARLIFFDNVYSYGRVEGTMTEETPYNPSSKKGEIRSRLAEKLMSEAKDGNIKAIIARSADFYGPFSEKTSIPSVLIISNLTKGKKAQWMVNVKSKHSLTYTADCGKALYLLSKADDSYNQVWHMPTAHPPLTGEEFIKKVAAKLNTSPEYTVLGKFMMRLGGLFDKQVAELYEMLYQYEFDYIFDSSKIEKRFGFTPTSYDAGIAETVSKIGTA